LTVLKKALPPPELDEELLDDMLELEDELDELTELLEELLELDKL
jgi:hypothetical protein